MAMQIGFTAQNPPKNTVKDPPSAPQKSTAPRPSVVRVRFEDGPSLSYYNDLFDLKVGDLVYVDGEKKNRLGRVSEVSHGFKIRRSEYQRVLCVVDREVRGRFFLSPSHLLTFERGAFERERARLWLCGPKNEDEEELVGYGDEVIGIAEFPRRAEDAVVERGERYFEEGRVHYLSLDGTHGYALVCGTEYYEVEFEFSFEEGLLSKLVCSCPCLGICKHEVAAVFSLLEVLGHIRHNYAEEYEKSGCFAAVDRERLLSLALEDKEKGSITF